MTAIQRISCTMRIAGSHWAKISSSLSICLSNFSGIISYYAFAVERKKGKSGDTPHPGRGRGAYVEQNAVEPT